MSLMENKDPASFGHHCIQHFHKSSTGRNLSKNRRFVVAVRYRIESISPKNRCHRLNMLRRIGGISRHMQDIRPSLIHLGIAHSEYSS